LFPKFLFITCIGGPLISQDSNANLPLQSISIRWHTCYEKTKPQVLFRRVAKDILITGNPLTWLHTRRECGPLILGTADCNDLVLEMWKRIKMEHIVSNKQYRPVLTMLHWLDRGGLGSQCKYRVKIMLGLGRQSLTGPYCGIRFLLPSPITSVEIRI